ncbi:hypothetical protein [Falsirhodobacter sp. 1013]|uniref:hypothetical protein n=1 Tax=Falsirhodobacter sp. 1013 TaxID=3417566 RepID=UPI003EB99A56
MIVEDGVVEVDDKGAVGLFNGRIAALRHGEGRKGNQGRQRQRRIFMTGPFWNVSSRR